jgi:hypothetical protein
MLFLSLLGAAAVATTPAPAYKAPHNAFGQPDFEGVWTNASLTSLERSAQVKTLTMSESEATRIEQMRARETDDGNKPLDPNAPAPPKAEDPGGYGVVWMDSGTRMGRIGGEIRTSWLVEPADGKLPYSSEGRKLLETTLQEARAHVDSPEGRHPGERCIIGYGSTAGPPMLNVLYNNNYQFQQTRDAVVIVVEMNHDARIIRIADKSRSGLRPWMGESVGRWEGDTLVVETTGFNPGESLRVYFRQTIFLSPNAKVTERFTRIAKAQILYEFSVDDPKVFSKPWRAQMAMNASKGPVYEYACHEGNYSLPGILAGARKTERDGGKVEVVDLAE